MNEPTIDSFLALLENAQSEYFGEPVTQLEHALQCAWLARAAGADDEMVIAALLHDIGHLIVEGGVLGSPDHDQEGAAYLRRFGFSDRVLELVAGHVQAKRYLTATNPDYFARLSDVSKQTLIDQGGPMSPVECEAFAQDPLLTDKLRLRSWDERAKLPNLEVAGLDSYRPLLANHLKRVCHTSEIQAL